mgnify:CR=1 FL=1
MNQEKENKVSETEEVKAQGESTEQKLSVEEDSASSQAKDAKGSIDSTEENAASQKEGSNKASQDSDPGKPESPSSESENTEKDTSEKPSSESESIEKNTSDKSSSESDSTEKNTSDKPSSESEKTNPYPEIPETEGKSEEELIEVLESLMKNYEAQHLRDAAEQVRRSFDALISEDKAKKKEAFIEGGGNEIDFAYENANKKKFYGLWEEYRARKQRHKELLEKRFNENMARREALIEELKSLIESEEKLNETFEHFRKIQEEWRNAGPVPRAEADEIFKTFHFHVERFYDYVRLNQELRDLDFKKNLQHKEALISEANQLLKLENVHEAFKRLQHLHKRWKQEGGPVGKEDREAIWEKFSAITHLIHEKRREAIQELKAKEAEVIKAKDEAIEKMGQLVKGLPDSHPKWQSAIRKSKAIMDEYKAAGHLQKSTNDKIWEKMRAHIRDFNHAKNQFYKEHKKELSDNLDKLKAIAQEAENVKESEEWKETSNFLKGLQADWKKIKPVPRKEADKIWKQFRESCNYFFHRLESEIKAGEEELVKHVEAREEFLKSLDPEKVQEEGKDLVSKIKAWQKEWKSMGQVPKKEVNRLEAEFRKKMDELFEKAGFSKKEKENFREASKYDKYVQAGDLRGLQREIYDLEKKHKSAEQELIKLETNIQFFTQTGGGNNPLMKQAEDRIKKQKSLVDRLEKSLNMAKNRMNSAKEA